MVRLDLPTNSMRIQSGQRTYTFVLACGVKMKVASGFTTTGKSGNKGLILILS